MYEKVFKRLLDLVIASVALLLLSPIFVLVTLSLFVANRGEAFFVQQRPGLNGKPFRLLKFKTMNDRRGSDGKLLADDVRLTAIGKVIRKTSLDEVPQLINVIVGEMSVIGPRPLLMEYLNLYDDRQKRRQFVRPGITGLAQINGRNAISWKEKFEYDVFYVDHVSFNLDLRIFFVTIFKVLKAEGISGRGVATAEKFNGNN